ncbi:MAG: hypothetical protein ACK41V_08630 [Acidovorax sp.]|uniref:hypothetical protein n=1 Tax=Acidovorax sp. TaxID=1872122 RepID=UPI00391D8546
MDEVNTSRSTLQKCDPLLATARAGFLLSLQGKADLILKPGCATRTAGCGLQEQFPADLAHMHKGMSGCAVNASTLANGHARRMPTPAFGHLCNAPSLREKKHAYMSLFVIGMPNA